MAQIVTYHSPRALPSLAASRLTTLERAGRTLTSTPHHLVLRGLAGSGRSVLAHHLLALAPSLGRRNRFVLSSDELATELYEPADSSEYFTKLRSFAEQRRRSIILLPDIGPLADGVTREDVRRLARFFRELTAYDIHVVTTALDEEILTLTALSQTLASCLTSIDVPRLEDTEIQAILGQHGAGELANAVAALARRFFPSVGLPGAALMLWHGAASIAAQQHTSPTLEHVHQFVAEQRGIPLEAIASAQHQRLVELPTYLRTRIIGQDHAITNVSSVLTRAHAGFRATQRPIASFLFLGPSGVGKTELAKALSSYLYRDPRAFVRIDMSEFSESHTVQRLVGAPPGYVGYEEGGQLTNPVEREPYSLVLLDEIEKAHPKVFDIFLQLLDDGRLTDGRGKTVDYSQTVVVATSNIGLSEIVRAARAGQLTTHDEFLTRTLLPLLVEHFRPEFLNRFDAIVVFQPLTPTALATIARNELATIRAQLAARQITLQVSDATLKQLAQRGYQPTFGARPIKRLIQDTIVSPIAERIVRGEIRVGEIIAV